MPVIISSAYVSAQDVALLIRAIANDMLYSQAGEILTDNANFMFPLLNDALDWMQYELNNHGVNSFTKETVLASVTPVGVNDPGTQVNVSDTGYFDGVTAVPAPQLPTDLMNPLFMWERQTGSTEEWVPMQEILDGLPSVQQGSRLVIWEYRQDALYMPGATQTNDLRLRYEGSQAQFATINDTLYIRGGASPLAYYMVSTYMASKNPDLANVCEDRAMKRLQQLATRNARMKQRAPSIRGSYGQPGNTLRFYPPRNP